MIVVFENVSILRLFPPGCNPVRFWNGCSRMDWSCESLSTHWSSLSLLPLTWIWHSHGLIRPPLALPSPVWAFVAHLQSTTAWVGYVTKCSHILATVRKRHSFGIRLWREPLFAHQYRPIMVLASLITISPFFEPGAPPPALPILIAQTEVGIVDTPCKLLAQEEIGSGPTVAWSARSSARYTPYPKSTSKHPLPPKPPNKDHDEGSDGDTSDSIRKTCFYLMPLYTLKFT